MISRFFKDSAIYTLAQISSKGIMILLLPFYTRVLSKAEVGWLDMLMGFYTIAGVVLGLEITNAQARFAGDAAHEAERRRTASTALLFTLTSFALFAAPGVVFAGQLGELILNESGQAGLMRWAVAAAAAMAVMTLITNQLRWALRPVAYGVAGILNTCVFALTTIVFVRFLGWGIHGVPLATIAGSAAAAAYTLWLIGRDFTAGFDWGMLRKMLAFSVPLVPSSLGAVAMLYVNRISVQQMMSDEDLGIFSVALRIAMMASLVMLGFSSALTPLIYANHQKAETPGRLADIFRYFCGLTLVGVGALWLYSREIILILAKPGYLSAAGPLCLLAMAVVLQQAYIFAPGPWITKRTGIVSMINLGGGVLNLVLCLLLVPAFGLMGAAWANLGTAAIVCLANFLVSQQGYPVPYTWLRIGMALVLTLAVAGLGLLVQRPPGWVDAAWKLPLTLAILSIPVLTGLVRRDEVGLAVQRLRRKRPPIPVHS